MSANPTLAFGSDYLSQPKRYFHRRHNGDGTHDSICHGCYVTVATLRVESELSRFEDSHVCDPLRAYKVSQYAHAAIRALLARSDPPRFREEWN